MDRGAELPQRAMGKPWTELHQCRCDVPVPHDEWESSCRLSEWTYCERDETAKHQHVSDRGTNRVATYQPQLGLEGCQLVLDGTRFEDLFFLLVCQLMRLQPLASAMEREREMDADIVSFLHIAPERTTDC